MTLAQAIAATEQQVASAVLIEQRATAEINRALDAGLARLRQSVAQNYGAFLDSGSLTLNSSAIAAQLGNALDLIPIEQTGRYQSLFGSLLSDSAGTGMLAAERQMLALAGEYNVSEVPPELQEHTEDAARRLFGHVSAYRAAAIATITLAIQQRWGEERVQQQLSTQVGQLKGKAQNIAATESGHGFSVALGIGLALAMGTEPRYVYWCVSFSEGTCSFCLARNGNVYRDNAVLLPAHGRCRCYTVPYSPTWHDRALMERRHRSGLRSLADAGLAPNYGVSSFERGAGITKAPKPFLRALDA